jgi:hypothetical protein
MMDMEMELSKQINLLFRGFKKEKVEQLIHKRQHNEDATINAFMNACKRVRDQISTEDSSKENRGSNSVENIVSCGLDIMKDLENKFCAMVADIEEKDRIRHDVQLKSCIDDFDEQHSLRVREIYEFLSSNDIFN